MNKINRKSGFSLIELLIVVTVLGIIAGIAIPNLIASRRTANEASTVGILRTIVSAESSYYVTVGSKNYATLSQLSASGYIDSVLGCASPPCLKSGYKFDVDAYPETGTLGSYFDGTAEPIQHSTGFSGTGAKSYYLNESGLIFYDFTATAPSGTTATQRKPTTGSNL